MAMLKCPRCGGDIPEGAAAPDSYCACPHCRGYYTAVIDAGSIRLVEGDPAQALGLGPAPEFADGTVARVRERVEERDREVVRRVSESPQEAKRRRGEEKYFWARMHAHPDGVMVPMFSYWQLFSLNREVRQYARQYRKMMTIVRSLLRDDVEQYVAGSLANTLCPETERAMFRECWDKIARISATNPALQEALKALGVETSPRTSAPQ